MDSPNASRSADESPARNKSNGGQSLDVLFVYPSYGDKATRDRLLPSRVSENIPNQESSNNGIGYLLAVAKKAG